MLKHMVVLRFLYSVDYWNVDPVEIIVVMDYVLSTEVIRTIVAPPCQLSFPG